MIVAGIHGGYEANTTTLALALVRHLSLHPDLVPGDVTLYILPVLNPDGLARSHSDEGRPNANGVDLNRNWDANWQAEWPLDGCWIYTPITAGSFPESEPETRALMEFIQAHELEALISYHSAALGIFPGGQPDTDPAAQTLAAQIAAVSPYPYPPLPTGCTYTGQLIDWAAMQGIPALDIELSTHEAIDWQINLDILQVFLTWPHP
jgi:predicted deacylase